MTEEKKPEGETSKEEPKEVQNPDFAKIRIENKALQAQLSERDAELAKFRDEQKKIEDEKLSETEKLKKENEALKLQAETAAKNLTRKEKEFKASSLFQQAGCVAPDDAIKLADIDKINLDDPTASQSFIEDFKKLKPHLFGEKSPAQVGTKESEPGAGHTGKDAEKKQKQDEAIKNNDSLGLLKVI